MIQRLWVFCDCGLYCMYKKKRTQNVKKQPQGPDGFPPGTLTEVQIRTNLQQLHRHCYITSWGRIYLFIGVDCLQQVDTGRTEAVERTKFMNPPVRLSVRPPRHVTWMPRKPPAPRARGWWLAGLALATEIDASGRRGQRGLHFWPKHT